jgi:1-acyl-sn-glycerol-3-phosphate acyltransferase
MGIVYDFWPRDDPSLHNQSTLKDITDEEFNATFAPRPLTTRQIWLQRFAFIFFFGWLRLICFFLFTLIFIAVVYPMAVIVPYVPFIRPIGIAIGKLYSRGILWCYGIWWVRIKGKMDPQTRQISYNHTTVSDGLLMYLVQTSTFVMMAGARKIPGFGRMFDALGAVYIDRSRQEGSSSLVADAIRNHAATPVAIAPEAKLSNGDVVFRFRTGGFLTSEQIQPLAFRYYRVFPAFGGGLSWFVPSFWDYLWTVFCSPAFIAEAVWLEPLRKEKIEKLSPQERADATQLAIANYLGTLAISRSTKEFFQKAEATEKTEGKEKTE